LNDRDAAAPVTEKPIGSAPMGTCDAAALPRLLMLCPHVETTCFDTTRSDYKAMLGLVDKDNSVVIISFTN